jgi:hypothetical protein
VSASFERLWKRLLAGGVAEGPARRYLAELKDHLDDLIAEERRAVSDPREAESRALSRLGSFEMLAEAMIERGEFQAWSRKAPFATYLLAPSAALAAVTALSVVGVVMTVKAVGDGAGAANPLPPWIHSLASSVVFFSHAMLPVLLAWALGVLAIRQRSLLLWPICGIVALIVLGDSVRVGLALPSPTSHGEVLISGHAWNSPGELIAFGGQLTLALVPYASLLLWRAARDRQQA